MFSPTVLKNTQQTDSKNVGKNINQDVPSSTSPITFPLQTTSFSSITTVVPSPCLAKGKEGRSNPFLPSPRRIYSSIPSASASSSARKLRGEKEKTTVEGNGLPSGGNGGRVSITYEEIGLFPRSFSRVLDRFLKQVFSDVENLIIQEYRFYRYLFLTTLKTIFLLIFFPFVVSFLAKNYLIKPLTEYFWNTDQTEIFLNSYQQTKAFSEFHDFEEKLYFESLLTIPILPKKKHSFSTSPSSIPFTSLSLPLPKESVPSYPPSPLLQKRISFPSLSIGDGREEEGTSFLPTDRKEGSKEKIRIGSFSSTSYTLLPSLTPFPKGLLSNLSLPSTSFDSLSFLSTNAIVLPLATPSEARGVTSSLSTTVNFSLAPTVLRIGSGEGEEASRRKEDKNYGASVPSEALAFFPPPYLSGKEFLRKKQRGSSATEGRESKLVVLLPLSPGKGREKEPLPQKRISFPSLSFVPPTYSVRVREEGRDGRKKKNKSKDRFDKKAIEKKLQEKTLALAIRFNNESIEAITNIFADTLSFFTLFFLLNYLEIQINITKSFLLEVFFGLEDSKKCLLILLVTDLLVGYHSPDSWELFLESFFAHYGLATSQTVVLLLVATLPVLLDVLFKYLIFRHLNRSSPTTVATYQALIE